MPDSPRSARKRLRRSNAFCEDDFVTPQKQPDLDSQISVLIQVPNIEPFPKDDAETDSDAERDMSESETRFPATQIDYFPEIPETQVDDTIPAVLPTLGNEDEEEKDEEAPEETPEDEETPVDEEVNHGILIREMRLTHPQIHWVASTRIGAMERAKELFSKPLKEFCRATFGQTSSPRWRFTGKPRNSHCTVVPHHIRFARMEVLFFGTGAACSELETTLISMFNPEVTDRCLNIRKGGDGPITPWMFVYIVWNSLDEFMARSLALRKRGLWF